MDGSRFDTLARSLTAAGSRRQMLRAVAGALGLLSLVHREEAEAKKKQCPPCKKRKKGKCRGKKPDGTVCGPDQVCSDGACLVRACGAGGPCRVFLSSILYDGDLGGLSGADAKCQGLAAAAGLPGSYKVWLSDGTDSPVTRFLTISPGPYRLVDGTQVVDSYEDLADGSLDAPINRTETGALVGEGILTWTNTRANGTGIRSEHGGEHCANWTSSADQALGVIGVANATDSTWTFAGPYPCASGLRLYCFQAS